MPFIAYYTDAGGTIKIIPSEEDVRQAFESKEGLLWVDIEGTTEEDGQFLERIFHFHNLPIHDCVSKGVHRSKVDNFGDYLFIIVHGINHLAESETLETTELDLFLGTRFVVSNHNLPMFSIEAVKHAVEKYDGRPMRRGADFLAHTIIDALIHNIRPIVDVMYSVMDDIEEEVLRTPQQSTLETIMQLKRSTIRLHRAVVPQTEVMNWMSRGDFSVISKDAQMFYRDLYADTLRIEELNISLQGRADNALATYMSSVANRQNETMKLLAIVATIFMPLTLLVGIYGMNFKHMPELEWSWSYFVVVGFIVFVIFASVWILWLQKWIPFRQPRKVLTRPFTIERDRLVNYVGHIKRWSHL
ncbi:MAG: magnesium/cobalt transporter CorA [Chloroflexota bacterium]|nr:magnesium/cobalt transporter CorA [Chloroflexota bacterium]